MKPKILFAGLFVFLLISACTPTGLVPVESTLDSTALYRFAQETVAVAASKTIAAQSPTPFRTSTPLNTPLPQPTVLVIPTSTRTLHPSATPLPTYTPIPTLTPAPTMVPGTCNQAAFVDDITIPDGTQMDAGARFTKTWRIKNVGVCTWTPAYQLAFVRGESMSGPNTTNLPGDVAPGATVDISIPLVAPQADGKYTGVYRMMDPSGQYFGSKVSTEFGVQVVIQVGTPPAAFAVTSVKMSADSATATGACPPGKTFNLHAEIVTNGPGTVKYHWIFSNGAASAVETLNYATAGPNTVHTNWTLGASGKLSPNPFGGWAQVYIDEPNHQSFSQQPIVMGCTN